MRNEVNWVRETTGLGPDARRRRGEARESKEDKLCRGTGIEDAGDTRTEGSQGTESPSGPHVEILARVAQGTRYLVLGEIVHLHRLSGGAGRPVWR